MKVKIPLRTEHFSETERLLAAAGTLRATVFRFASGVPALRMTSDAGGLVLLPFQGQQIWSARFGDRDLTMRSGFEQPRPTRAFLETFGGFLQHCGATAAGSPGPEDNHPLHGELPNAPYGQAYLELGQDEEGDYIRMGGCYRHTVFFSHDYSAEPVVTLRPGQTRCAVSMTITNRKRSPMELFYLAHVNFRPVDGARLIDSTADYPDAVRVRASVPAHITPGPGYRAFLQELQRDPHRLHRIAPDLPLDPEVVLFIDYRADKTGWAHTLQVHPDGSADYIGHRPAQLPRATRWISRTPDHDAIALVEPGTCEPEGYTAEKRKGNVLHLAAGESFRCDLQIGHLSPAEASDLEVSIAAGSGNTPNQ